MPSSPRSDLPTAALPTAADVRAAADRLAGVAIRTPLLESPLLNARLGGRLLVKAEPLQRTGSFKFRGAYNRIAQIAPEQRAMGVVATSSGNHAQGVAAAAALFGIPATVVMPADAPAIKRHNAEALGATVVAYDRDRDDRNAMTEELAQRSGATVVPPFDDPAIIAGQGTVGLEIAGQTDALGIRPDAVLVCCGGGGLVSGTALALSETLPGVPVWCVEPAAFDDTKRSLAAGKRLSNPPEARSICDALLSATPGVMTFALNSRLLAGGLAVGDDEVRLAMRVAFEMLKLVVEPGGAVAIAAALTGKIPVAGRTIVAVASGGNVDPETYRNALAA